MKQYLMVLFFLLGLSSVSLSQEVKKNVKATENTTENFKVYGNCGMCKRTIEGALSNLEGISKGTWNIESKKLTVVFDPTILSIDLIKQEIANVGYDSDTHRAKVDVYKQLPGCCQYERPQ